MRLWRVALLAMLTAILACVSDRRKAELRRVTAHAKTRGVGRTVSWLERHAQLCLVLACCVGLGRIVFYDLGHESVIIRAPVYAAASYESLRPHLSGVRAVGYVSDEHLDEDPTAPRSHDAADMAYARAQYALAPTILSRTAEPLVLANFASAEALDRYIAASGSVVIARPIPTAALIRSK